MSGGSHKVCDSLENAELTYVSSDTEIHHFQEWLEVRIGFVTVLKTMN